MFAPSVSFYLPTPAALDSHRSSWPNVRQHNRVLETVFARLLHLPTFLAVILLRYCTIWTCGLHIATDTSAYFRPVGMPLGYALLHSPNRIW